MSNDIQELKADIAFVRALTDDGGHAFARSGALLVVVGVVFGLVNLQYWLVYRELLAVPRAWVPWLWLEGVAVLLVAMPLVMRRFPARPSAASRAMLAAWGAVGIGITAAGIALGIGGERMGFVSFVPMVFPIVLFTLYGAAWWVAFAVKRQTWFALVAGACFLAAIACGFVMGSQNAWLVLALGLLLLVALPGAAIVRQARRE
jgi:hypothetical protein